MVIYFMCLSRRRVLLLFYRDFWKMARRVASIFSFIGREKSRIFL